MRGIATAWQFWRHRCAPAVIAHVIRLLYSSANVSIGSTFRADGFPRCMVDRSATLRIGDQVLFREDVEIRAHGTSQIIVEDGVRVDRGVRILATNDAVVRIGKGSRIGLYCVFNCGDSLTVGNDSLVSGCVYLQTSMHRFCEAGIPAKDQGYTHAPVLIGHNVWLGAHVVVMPGVAVGDNVVVGSNAVVTRSIEPGSVVAGVPARPLAQQSPAGGAHA